MKCARCATRCEDCDAALKNRELLYADEVPVQMIPATGWRAVFDAGDKDEFQQVIAWGLTARGSVIPLTADETAVVDDPRSCSNFLRIEHVEHVN